MRKTLRLIWIIITAPFRFVIWLFRKIVKGFRNFFHDAYLFFTEEEEDTPLPDAFAKTIQNPQGILYHVNILRKHLFRAAVAVVITTAISFTFAQKTLLFLSAPLGANGLDRLRAIDVTENIGTVMRVSLLIGFALAFPYVIFELWMFIAPGVHRRSRLMGFFSIPIATLFFVGGMAFAYYIMLPVALNFLLGDFLGLKTEARPASYFSFVTSVMFWIGISFEFPLVIYVLASVGIVRGESLAQQWRFAIVIISIVAAAITPTIDPINMGLVMGPMILLYFLSIGLAYIAQRGRAKREEAT
jgi:sec-independent protein translocase protein TatC